MAVLHVKELEDEQPLGIELRTFAPFRTAIVVLMILAFLGLALS